MRRHTMCKTATATLTVLQKISVDPDPQGAVPGGHDTLIGKSMTTGTVKWFNSAKGYGFIEPEDGSKDAFVHISAVERAGLHGLSEGQKVSYELQSNQNGKTSAENLTIIN